MTVELLLTLLLAIPGSVAAALGCTLWMLAGAGSGLPLSRQGTAPDADERESGLGVTTPSWRALVQVRFTE